MAKKNEDSPIEKVEEAAEKVTQAATSSKMSSAGLEENIAAAISYVPLIGLVFLFLEKESELVRFHSIQSVLMQIIVFAFMFIPFLWLIGFVLQAFLVLVSLFGAYKAYSNEKYKFPIVGDIAEQQAGNFPK